MQVPEIDLEAAAAHLEAEDAVFMDVRDKGSFAAAHVPGAVNVSDSDIQEFLDTRDKARKVIVYCYHGNMSLGGAAYLMQNGFLDVASLRGTLVIRLPERVAALRFGRAELGAEVEAPGLSVRIAELGRDRFTLRASEGGDRVLGARAYNIFGDELWIPHSNVERRENGSVDLKLQVRGVPEKIELRYAEKLARAEYPFTLTKGDSQVALSAR